MARQELQMSEIVRKIQPAQTTAGAGAANASGAQAGSLDRNIRFRVVATTEAGQKKRAEVWSEASGGPASSRWSIECDEGARLGGGDSAPSPLAYFSAGVAF
jgi:hypothetical protein